MGVKYIVELGRCERLYKAFVSGNGKPDLTWLSPEIDLTPYAEPDMEQVRKEAYKDGYDAGFGRKIDASYQEGLSDAWDAAMNISHMDSKTRDEVFGLVITSNIFDENTASEAIEKIRQYEQEERFHVGDEFENEIGRRFVILKMDGTEIDRYIDKEGKTYCMIAKYEVMRKTGRHFPEIAEVLQKMKETDNG